ncbi:unnamed protein product [Caenorhabditis angaria]|uniref:Uncharacterized protein n=1 Tax=Caenorhabditis angaria TaxID=860376 RepID=A0A9P1N4R4_9PELO|nr:unnamed protein product [Caenorhabditis angaria]
MEKGQESSTSFPSFWRSPITTTSRSFQQIEMPGSDQDIHIVGHGEDIVPEKTGGLTDHRTHNYVNRPEGEMDMMIGFFLMNGVCIFFFLLFGLCVIFSCLRKRPSFLRPRNFIDIEQVPLNAEDSNAVKPKLRSIVSQVIKTNKVTTTVAADEQDDSKNIGQQNEQVKVHSFTSRSPSPQALSPSTHKRTSLVATTSGRKQSIESRRCSISQENSAMIRHNLLGPLSFDDLYYM